MLEGLDGYFKKSVFQVFTLSVSLNNAQIIHANHIILSSSYQKHRVSLTEILKSKHFGQIRKRLVVS